MANKKNRAPIPQPAPKTGPVAVKEESAASSGSTGFNLVEWIKTNPYAPGILLFLVALIIGFIVYKDYGICWDEPLQRGPGILSYEYMFNGNEDLFHRTTDNHGAGFEVMLIMIERWFNITDERAVYEMRHLVTHLVFLAGVFAGYVLAYRLFKNRFIATLGFLMLVLAPRLYAHSFFNSKDLPFLSMFLITLAVCQAAFSQNKRWLFVVLGLVCGYATSIRIMGIMLAAFIVVFLLIDTAVAYAQKEEKPNKHLMNLLFFAFGCCFTIYIAWPYLWKDPVHNFVESFAKLSHFNFFSGIMLLGGKYVSSMNLPWTYFPTWFLISNPILWLVLGFAGFIWAGIAFLGKPLQFLKNNAERNYLLYILSFAGPIAAVLLLHSVIYDDWRHLYFVYPSFVMLALYCANKIYGSKYRKVIIGACALQVLLICVFMVSAHPFQQVYFNEFVSHGDESLRKNYELDYWGCAYKQALCHLVKENTSGPIKVFSSMQQPVENNTLMLEEQDRGRIRFVQREQADYIITNFRNHPYDYPIANIDYSIKVQNSSILTIYKEEADSVKRRQLLLQEISSLDKAVATQPNDHFLRSTLGDAYFWNDEYDSATAQYLQAMALQPNCLAIIDFAGDYFMKRKYDDAVMFCKKAIELTPRDLNAHINIGLCYMRLSKFDSAVIYLKKATDIDAESIGAYTNLAYTFRAMGQADSAKKYERMAQKFAPEFKLN